MRQWSYETRDISNHTNSYLTPRLMFLFADEVVQKAKSFPVVFGHATAARRWLYLGLSSDWSGAGRVCRKLGRFVNLTASSHFVTLPVCRDHGVVNWLHVVLQTDVLSFGLLCLSLPLILSQVLYYSTIGSLAPKSIWASFPTHKCLQLQHYNSSGLGKKRAPRLG